MEIINGFWDALKGIYQGSGLMNLDWRNYLMIGIACVLFFLAIKKQFEPLLLLPIAFGMLLVNLFPAIVAGPTTEMIPVKPEELDHYSNYAKTIIDGQTFVSKPTSGGLFFYLYQGVKLGIYPPLIFLGVGAMTDFGPLIANPKSFILGALTVLRLSSLPQSSLRTCSAQSLSRLIRIWLWCRLFSPRLCELSQQRRRELSL